MLVILVLYNFTPALFFSPHMVDLYLFRDIVSTRFLTFFSIKKILGRQAPIVLYSPTRLRTSQIRQSGMRCENGRSEICSGGNFFFYRAACVCQWPHPELPPIAFAQKLVSGSVAGPGPPSAVATWPTYGPPAPVVHKLITRGAPDRVVVLRGCRRPYAVHMPRARAGCLASRRARAGHAWDG